MSDNIFWMDKFFIFSINMIMNIVFKGMFGIISCCNIKFSIRFFID